MENHKKEISKINEDIIPKTTIIYFINKLYNNLFSEDIK
jgi:hypothetical protein